ncbi:MAG: transketolase, partial [Rhodothermia bacterium]|nr:transketolase [Rhodothermia bacterium]
MTPSAARSATSIAELSINTIRFLSIDAVQKANSGHPGLPMGAAPMAYVLWKHFLKHSPQNPQWVDRDRFVLSAGHGSMLLYALLHLTGYDLTIDDLKEFRQLKSRTPGHPENFMTPGVETTTGPLGQGFANGVGMAIAEKILSAKFNGPEFKIVDHYTYGIVSDGDLMEGVSHEAASLAGHHGLGKLIYLYDDNNISIDGSTNLAFTEDVPARFEGYGWHVVQVADGNDTEAIADALSAAKEEKERPSLVVVKTIIGFGSPNLADTAKVHGSPLGEEEVALTKRNLGWPENMSFFVPDDVREHMAEALHDGARLEQDWQSSFDEYRERFPDDAASFERWMSGDLGDEWKDQLPVFDLDERMATRASSGKVLDAAGQRLHFLVGGSADLSGSNKTFIRGREPFQKERPDGTYFHFGVREHGMAAICNGLVLHGGFRPYCGTFLVFSDYMRPSIRLAALMGLPVIYVFTHD